ncbi:MAG: FKBP-type peptidyl-prolyl cis-trans isomerase [Candidatus Kapabacteria bacterium]|nr:FKBP-type peptidyl-prolyl cis-trans isomerase [Candidatus Kapabacteria bacterium]
MLHAQQDSSSKSPVIKDSFDLLIQYMYRPADTAIATQGLMKEVRDTSGMYYMDIAVGKGDTAKQGRLVFIRMIGYRQDGTLFSTDFAKNKLYSFTIGDADVIRGLQAGVTGMREGGRRHLRVPSKAAYGAKGFGSARIPPNTTIEFDVELIKVER